MRWLWGFATLEDSRPRLSVRCTPPGGEYRGVSSLIGWTVTWYYGKCGT